MKIRDLRLDDGVSVNVKDIPMETVFSGTIGDIAHGGVTSIFLRAFSVVVDLRNPKYTWIFNLFSTGECFDCITVNNYRPLNAQLVVGSKDEHS